MNKLKALLDPTIEELILKSCNIHAKRSPLWFFKTDMTSALKEKYPTDRQVSISEIHQRWRSLDLETKRKYFELSRIDELRFKEQKTLWIAEVGSLLMKFGDDKERLKEKIQTLESKLSKSDEATSKYQREYQHMLQVASTIDMYKKAVDSSNRGNCPFDRQDELLQQVPDSCKNIICKPRRPSTSFVLFVLDNIKELAQLRQEKCPDMSLRTFYADQWSKLEPEKKKHYRDKYAMLLEDYQQAMKDYKVNVKDNYLEQATKERSRSSKCLRRKLREYALTPLCVRNPFNFFVHANAKEATGLSSAWKKLSDEERGKFQELYRRDLERYQREKELYAKLTEALSHIIHKQIKSPKKVEVE